MASPLNHLVAKARSAYLAGRYGEAKAACEEVLASDRRNLTALELLGRLAMQRGVPDEALRRFRACATAAPREPEYVYLVGLALADLGRTDEAIRTFDRVLEARPGMELVVQSKASALERIGDGAAARALLAPQESEGRLPPAMTALLARLDAREGRAGDGIDRLRRRLQEDAGLQPGERQALLFGLSAACDRAGAYDDAFAAAAEAKGIDARPFDREAYRARVDRTIALFTPERIASLPRAADRSDRPVMIVGMPRSGTTLVEQIIDAHPRAHGAGELTFLPELLGRLQMELDSYEPYPDCLEDLDAAACNRFAAGYLNLLRSFSRTAARIVDKSLDNFEHLGLLSLLCPGGRAIATVREPMDTCLSCFLNPILPNRFPWISDVRDIGFVYGQHRRLVRHWREVLEIPILAVEYRRLIDEPEPTTRAIIEFTGLPWNDRCLRFHASGRTVMTLSYDQVSRPLYRSSLERWRNYEKHLEGLREELEGSHEP